jgi:predicted AlkP superfamily pyrophosphatase or phosphodiesterase
MRRWVPCVLLIWLAATAPAAPPQAPSRQPPSLVVLIAIDQFRPDYLTRYGHQFTGGLARLSAEGAVFPDVDLDYGAAATAAGHATMLSGRLPRSHGIFRNDDSVDDSRFALLTGGTGASPAQFRGTSLIDWLQAARPGARMLSVSAKAESAILMAGRAREHVYWYDNGPFTTSTYYRDSLPEWVSAFNRRGMAEAAAGRVWDLLLSADQYGPPGPRDVTFPQRAPEDPSAVARELMALPWIDDLTFALALQGVQALALGTGAQPDLLAISLTATDYIGHNHGAFSRAVHDQLLRLDRSLGLFLDSLFALRDPASVLIALTSDHGILPEGPEVDPGIIEERVDLRAALAAARAGFNPRAAGLAAVRFSHGMLMLDSAAFAAAGVDREAVLQQFLAAARQNPGVLRADRVRDLAAADTVGDVVARRWLHALPADAGVDLVLTPQPNRYWTGSRYANHGTPHDYDTRVPIMLWGEAIRSGRYESRVRLVDLAPTLARVLGVAPLEAVDGKVLEAALLP